MVLVRIPYGGVDLVDFAPSYLMMFIHSRCYVCEYVTLHGKRDFTYRVNVGNQPTLRKGDFPGLFMWAQCNHMGP